MKQTITSEKIKKLELKKSMLNFKNFSLMKKQLFSLVLLLAIFVFAGNRVMAQTGLPTDPMIHFTGSEHTYSVTDQSATGNTYAWLIFTATGSPLASTGEAADVAHYSGVSGTATNSFTFTWTPAASGNYCIQVTESNESTRGSCGTIRQYFVLVIDFDLHLFASTSAGAEISAAADLVTCGSNFEYDPFFNDDVDLTSVAYQAMGGATGPYSTRYFTATLTASAGIDLANVDYRWTFPYTITGGDDTYDVSIVPVNHTGAVVVTYTSYNSGSVVVNLDANVTVTSVTFEIRYQPKWNNAEADILLTVNNAVNTCMLDGTDTDLLFDDGVESTANYGNVPGAADPLSNVTRQQTIYVSPATSIISVGE
jgi:hypothetical protein